MSFLKDLEKIKTEEKEVVKQTVKQKVETVKQIDDFQVNPSVNTINDIPNTNIITSGRLLGVRLRASKEKMLEQLIKYINDLINDKKN